MGYMVYIQDEIRDQNENTLSFIAQQWSGTVYDTHEEAEAELAVCQAQWPDATIIEV